MREVLNGIKASRPEFAWIGFAAPDGTVLAASGGLIEGVSVADRPWFRTALAGPMVGDVHEAKLLATLLEDDGTGEPFRFVDIAFPLNVGWPDDRCPRRSSELAMGEHVARARVAANAAPSETDIWVLSRDGVVLLGSELGSKPFSADRLAAMRDSRHGAFVDTTAAGAYLTSYAVTRGYGDYPGLGWTVIARQPESTAFARARELAGIIAWLGVPVALLGIAAALAIAGRISRPIRAITAHADRLGRDPSASMLPRESGRRKSCSFPARCARCCGASASSSSARSRRSSVNRKMPRSSPTICARCASSPTPIR